MQVKDDLSNRVREYVGIVEFLKKIGEKEELHISENSIYVKREKLESLLEQFGKYDETQMKLRIWKRLQWIDAPESRITSQLRIGNKRVQRIKINRKVAETLLELVGISYEGNKILNSEREIRGEENGKN